MVSSLDLEKNVMDEDQIEETILRLEQMAGVAPIPTGPSRTINHRAFLA